MKILRYIGWGYNEYIASNAGRERTWRVLFMVYGLWVISESIFDIMFITEAWKRKWQLLFRVQGSVLV